MFIINERIKLLRTQKGITQKQLATIINVQPVTLQRFEYGTVRPSLDTLAILADYFNVSLDYLVGRSNFKSVVTEDEEGNIVTVNSDNPEINK